MKASDFIWLVAIFLIFLLASLTWELAAVAEEVELRIVYRGLALYLLSSGFITLKKALNEIKP